MKEAETRMYAIIIKNILPIYHLKYQKERVVQATKLLLFLTTQTNQVCQKYLNQDQVVISRLSNKLC